MIPWRVATWLLLGTAACGASHKCRNDQDWSALVQAHFQRYPALQADDAYKLLHQATMGSEHAISDRKGPTEWMTREWAEMGEGPGEPLIDTLGSRGRFARIHLRQWKAIGGSPDRLVDVFVLTANSARPDSAELTCALSALVAAARAGRIPLDASALDSMASLRAGEGFPAVHHSPGFETNYRPAYRVVSLALVPRLRATLQPGSR